MTREELQRLREWRRHSLHNLHCMNEWQLAICVLLENRDALELALVNAMACIRTHEDAIRADHGNSNFNSATAMSHAALSFGVYRCAGCGDRTGGCSCRDEKRAT